MYLETFLLASQSPDTSLAPARHAEAGAGHVHRLAGHGELGGARLRHAARVADRDLGPEPRVPDLWVRNIRISIN